MSESRITADGSPTLVHPEHGQCFHSEAGAWTEACERYARACEIGVRDVRLLDVGTGLGLNLAAALDAARRGGRMLDAVSLELDPGVIERTLALPEPDLESPWGPSWSVVRDTLRRALADPAAAARPAGLAWREDPGDGRLRLLLGDARLRIRELGLEPRFDAVFLDPFSPAVEPDLWQPAFLGEVAVRMAPDAWLSTYSASLSVRVHLRAAGLRVGRGPRVGSKSAGTLASPERVPPALDERTSAKLERRLARLQSAPPGTARRP